MADLAEVYPSKLICGILYHESVELEAVYERLIESWGELELVSDAYEFSGGSDYYESEMGKPVFRRFVSFKNRVRPETLADQKLLTQAIELEWTKMGLSPQRPLNLDPGHITRGRMLLATTKDYAHRIYLHSGIYAEVTLMFKKKKIEHLPWTYPDLASGFWDEFLLENRDLYQKNLNPIKL